MRDIAQQNHHLAAERERFAQVMAARKSSRDLIALAEKLSESDKFSSHCKPYCFADLVLACTTRVANGAIEDLLVALKVVWAGDIIRNVLKDAADPALRGLVRRALELAAKDDSVERRLHLMLFAGITKSDEHAIELAISAGLPPEAAQRVRDALARLCARPIDDSCPF